MLRFGLWIEREPRVQDSEATKYMTEDQKPCGTVPISADGIMDRPFSLMPCEPQEVDATLGGNMKKGQIQWTELKSRMAKKTQENT